jgi:enterochelin esterase-like enzyme
MVADRIGIYSRRWPLLLVAFAWALMAFAPPSQSAMGGVPWACRETTGQIITLKVPSQAYHKPVASSVYVPPCYDWTPGKIPVIYLLHGGNADETQWPDLRVRQEADALIAQGAAPFVVVMPGGLYGVGTDYATFVLNDLIPAIEGRLRVRTDGAGRAIGGISLGGYWALKVAFQHPDLVAAVGGHSPVTTRTGGPDDPFSLAATAPGLDRLHITLDAGNLDSLRASTEQLAGTLSARGLFVALTISPGSHNRPYWRAHTAEYLRFYLDAIGAIPPSTSCAHTRLLAGGLPR